MTAMTSMTAMTCPTSSIGPAGTIPPGASIPSGATGRPRGQGGFVAGAEALLFGTLVLLAGSLLLANAWMVIDTRVAVESAAREYLRGYTESDDPAHAHDAGLRAATDVLAGRGIRAEVDAPDAPFGPCARAEVTISATVAAVRLPFVDGLGRREVSATRVEFVDAHRMMQASPAHEPERTPCG
jgi:hypothetical protein